MGGFLKRVPAETSKSWKPLLNTILVLWRLSRNGLHKVAGKRCRAACHFGKNPSADHNVEVCIISNAHKACTTAPVASFAAAQSASPGVGDCDKDEEV